MGRGGDAARVCQNYVWVYKIRGCLFGVPIYTILGVPYFRNLACRVSGLGPEAHERGEHLGPGGLWFGFGVYGLEVA